MITFLSIAANMLIKVWELGSFAPYLFALVYQTKYMYTFLHPQSMYPGNQTSLNKLLLY